MKNIIFFILFLTTACVSKQKCVDEINYLPMYGHKAKCEIQLQADKDFVQYCTQQFKDKKEAADYYVQRAWELIKRKQLDSSMFKLNQAWMLDSLNASIYFGFGSIMGMRQKYNESIELLQKSTYLNSNNPKAWDNLGTSYCNLFAQAPNANLLNRAINALQKAIVLDPNATHALSQLALAYYYSGKRDSARIVMEKADSISPQAIKPDVRAMILGAE